jgi:outer membrane protein TolC
LKRQISLEVYKAYEDFITASNKLHVARQQLRQAEHSYEQAFGEYRVGRADILSLVKAGSQLSDAMEQLIASKLNLILSRVMIERVAGIERLEDL